MASNNESVASQLYDAVTEALESGWSINQIAQSAGIHQSSLHNWYSGRRQSLSLETVNLLCRHFGMRLTDPTIASPPADSQEPRRKPKAKRTVKKKSAKKARP